ncbi:hypothetical protein MNBD_UNCLBAC01-564 [hydrothermal vent metagenome]|uniref:Uncharacterized protein n=1 Tax=hydrothermal vent metagenome TaxID=652676 RepID=A0A3B1DN73_9ZZZZ
MFKRLIKNKKAQNTAEYAILISLVVAGIIAMQTYAQRALQARVRDAGQYLATETSDMGSTNQYEPYYLSTDYNIDRADEETTLLGAGMASKVVDSNRTRAEGGSQLSTYDTAVGLITGM